MILIVLFDHKECLRTFLYLVYQILLRHFDLILHQIQDFIKDKKLEKREKAVKNEISDTISELDEKRLEKDEISKTFYEIEAKRNELTRIGKEIEAKAAAKEDIEAYFDIVSMEAEKAKHPLY